jgi:hypothetical protein
MGRQVKRQAFDRNLYDDNDSAKELVLEFLNATTEATWSVGEDPYGPDLENDETTELVEVEVKHNWKSGIADFPFTTVQLPERKSKWKDLPISFWVLRSDHQRAIIIPASALQEKYLKEVSNKFVRKGEYFYQIPVELTTLVVLGE